jgi:hypothetical protein
VWCVRRFRSFSLMVESAAPARSLTHFGSVWCVRRLRSFSLMVESAAPARSLTHFGSVWCVRRLRSFSWHQDGKLDWVSIIPAMTERMKSSASSVIPPATPP